MQASSSARGARPLLGRQGKFVLKHFASKDSSFDNNAVRLSLPKTEIERTGWHLR
jgi:hypothetical protein